MKKLLSIILTIWLVLSVVPSGLFSITVSAATCGTTGNCTWWINGTELIIGGDGQMGNYGEYNNAPWGTNITKVFIQNGVENIGSFAFYNCTGLTSVTIPNRITSIGDFAFYNCTGLINITIPDSITCIGRSAFKNTGYYNNLDNWESDVIYINRHLIKVKDSFSGTYNIKEDTLTIAGEAFKGCIELTNVTIPNSVISIGSDAFRDCSGLSSVTIPSSVTSIGGYAFYGCTELENITIPDSVISIEAGTFQGCTGLTSITIPNSVKSIEDFAFYGCGVKNVYYNSTYRNRIENLKIADYNANLKNALWHYQDGENLAYTYNEETLTATLISANKTIINEIIPSSVVKGSKTYSVTSIGDYAFYNCTELKKITIPDSITNIGYKAFYYCSSLTSITVPDSVISIGEFTFTGCTGLTSITIPFVGQNADGSGKTHFGYIFGASNNIQSISLYVPSLLKTVVITNENCIDDSAFYYCKSLTSITIPQSVTSIGSLAFFGCTELADVYYDGSWFSKNNITIGSENGNLTGATWHYTSIDYFLDYSHNDKTLTSTITDCAPFASSVNIPSTVTKEDKTYIVTSIGENAFQGCSNHLTSVTIPDSITTIRKYAFEDCTRLTKANITDLSAWCNIKFDTQTSNPLFFAGNLYLNNELITNLVIPNDVTSISDFAFNRCIGLTSIIIPNSINSIGDYAFYGCTNLTTVTISDSVTNIGSSAFEHCDNLTDVYYYGNAEDKNNININQGNTYLENAQWHYICRYGDANGDGKINSLDLTELKIIILSGETNYDSNIACDVKADKRIDILDLVRLKKYLAGIDVPLGKS